MKLKLTILALSLALVSAAPGLLPELPRQTSPLPALAMHHTKKAPAGPGLSSVRAVMLLYHSTILTMRRVRGSTSTRRSFT